MARLTQLGTKVRLPDGRIGTVVFNSLIGVGIKWGIHDPDPEDFVGTAGNTTRGERPPGFEWEPDALLRDPWPGCETYGFTPEQCVGDGEALDRDGTDATEYAARVGSDLVTP